jgi:hypothetical protein
MSRGFFYDQNSVPLIDSGVSLPRIQISDGSQVGSFQYGLTTQHQSISIFPQPGQTHYSQPEFIQAAFGDHVLNRVVQPNNSEFASLNTSHISNRPQASYVIHVQA